MLNAGKSTRPATSGVQAGRPARAVFASTGTAVANLLETASQGRVLLRFFLKKGWEKLEQYLENLQTAAAVVHTLSTSGASTLSTLDIVHRRCTAASALSSAVERVRVARDLRRVVVLAPSFSGSTYTASPYVSASVPCGKMATSIQKCYGRLLWDSACTNVAQ